MIPIINSNKQKAQYFLEVAQNCRKKAEMYDKLIASGKVSGKELSDLMKKSRQWWSKHEDYTKAMGDIIDEPFPKSETIDDIEEKIKRIFES